jgi:hypothetical protein
MRPENWGENENVSQVARDGKNENVSQVARDGKNENVF